MSIEIQATWLACVFLLWIRFSVVFISNPLLSWASLPMPVRILLPLIISVAVTATLDHAHMQHVPATLSALLVDAMMELATGGLLAFGLACAFAAFSAAGKLIDVQTGFGLSSVFDPLSRQGASIFGTLLALLAAVLFFSTETHLVLMRAFAWSVEKVPPGASREFSSPSELASQFGLTFSLAVGLIAPLMLCLFLIEAGLDMVSRVLPQMNVFVVGMPVKIAFSLISLGLVLRLSESRTSAIFGAFARFLDRSI